MSLYCVSKGPIDNKSALIQTMAWRWTGGKLLPEPILTKIYDAIWCHKATLSINIHYSDDKSEIGGKKAVTPLTLSTNAPANSC